MRKILLLLAISSLLFSCEDVVDISDTLKPGTPELVVDAFLNNLPEPQTVRLSTTQYYFDNSGPKPATGAVVSVMDLQSQKIYAFSETSPGIYTSTALGDSMLKVGNNYQLSVEYKGDQYSANSKVGRVVPIDSIKFEEAEDATGEVVAGKYNAEFFSTDSVGIGDRYWIRSYKNDKRNTGSDNLGVAYDANFGPNGHLDGAVFILPLRQFVINEQELDDKFKDEDKLMVELYSITDETAFFFSEVVTQSQLGEGGALGAMFSPPPANVSTNIKNNNEKGNKAVGYFCTSAVSRATTYVPVPYYK